MGYIREPDGIDFLIKGKPLTDQQKQTITDFIKADKDRVARTQRIRRMSCQDGGAEDKA